MKLVRCLLAWLLAVTVVHEVTARPQRRREFIDKAWDKAKEIGSDAVGVIEDGFDYVTDGSLIDDLSSIGDAIASAAVSVGQFFETLGETLIDPTFISDLWDAVYTVTGLEAAVEGFESINWDKIGDAAKTLLNTVSDAVVTFVNNAVDFLTDFFDLNFLPFPLDVLKIQDFGTIVDCYGDLMLEASLEFAKSVAQAYAEMATLGEAAPLFNDRGLESEIEDTRVCMDALAQDMYDRQSSSDSPIQAGIDEALAWFDMPDFTIGLEISFTLCVAVCGTAAIGFAFSLFTVQLGVYLALGLSIELSPSVGASIEIAMNFWPAFGSVPGEVYVVEMSSNIPVLGNLPAMAIDMYGNFGGFSISSTLLATPSGAGDVFNIGAGYVYTQWLTLVTTIDAEYNDTITNTTNGGFLFRGKYYAWGSEDAEDYCENTGAITYEGTAYDCGKAYEVTLQCPGTDFTDPNVLPGNMSSVKLAYVWIDEVMHGTAVNTTGVTYHNTSTGYNFVYTSCAMEPSCTFSPEDDMLADIQYLSDQTNRRLVGPDNCNEVPIDADDQCLINIDVLFSCPPADYSTAFNAGCYDINVFELYLELFYSGQDTDLILESNPNDEFWWLDDDFNSRTNSIAKCSAAARALGEDAFGFHNQQCFAGPGLFDIYQNYTNVECPDDGLGDFSTLQVWVFQDAVISWEDQGCRNLSYLEKHNAILVDMEDHHVLTQDVYQDRLSAVSKCGQMAKQYNLTSFALLDGGQCYIMCVDDDFTDVNATFECTNNGKGTSDIFNVYKFATTNTTTCSVPDSLIVYSLGYDAALTTNDDGLSDGAIIGIAVGCVLFVLFVSGALVGGWWWKTKRDDFGNATTKLGIKVDGVVPGQGFKVGQTNTALEGTNSTSQTLVNTNNKKQEQVKSPPRVGNISGRGGPAGPGAAGHKPSWMD